MDRRKFFQKIGIASLGVIIAPAVVAGVIKKAIKPQKVLYGVIVPKCRRTGFGLITNNDLIMQYPLTYNECFKNRPNG